MAKIPAMSRRQFAKIAAVGSASMALGGIVSGCTKENNSGSSETAPRDEVIIALPASCEPPAGFDPFVAWGCGEHVHEPLIQSTLVKTGVDMSLENDLAVSYACSPDALVWTFKIRDDVVFSDGEPLTADDVAFTINGIKDAPSSEADFSMIDKAVAVDATTVKIYLLHPYNILLYTLAVVGICPKHAHNVDYGQKPIGSGRFVLEQWDRGQQVIFTANPLYYGNLPHIKRVVVVFMDDDAALAAVQSKHVDLAYTSAILADTKVVGYSLLSVKTVDSRGIAFPVLPANSDFVVGGETIKAGNDATCEKSLRQAMSYAVNRQLLIDRSLNGHATPAFSVCDGMPWASKDMIVKESVEHAREILIQDGWNMGSDGVLEKDGKRAEFTLYYMTDDMMRQAMAADFAEQMKPLGIKVNVEGKPWEDLEPKSYTDPQLWGWGSNSPAEIYDINHSKGGANFACRSDMITDALLEEAVSEIDLSGSYPLYAEAQFDGIQGVTPDTDATWVWLANVDHLYFVCEGLSVAPQKLHPHGHGWSIVNNVDEWHW